MTSLSNLMWVLGPLLASSQVIVGQRWPPPRWFLSGSVPPPGNNFVVAQTVQVVAQTVSVIVPT